jgi:hypothetical protein
MADDRVGKMIVIHCRLKRFMDEEISFLLITGSSGACRSPELSPSKNCTIRLVFIDLPRSAP